MTVDVQLLAGEQITFQQEKLPTDGPLPSDAEIEQKYIKGEVRIVIEQARYPLKQIPEIVASSDYNLQPDFQRRPRWSKEKQSRLIESLIMNVPVPPVFLYESQYGRYEVMDGRQRLTAIKEYYTNTFPLEGLKEWSELNGRTYVQLPEQIRRGIDRRFLSAIVLLHETAKSDELADRLKQLVFERINSGGEDLSPQEKRNALFPGPMNKMCIELARNPSLCRLWGIPAPTTAEISKAPGWEPPQDLVDNESFKTMEDVELVLRFYAHRQRARLWRSGMRLEEFLTQYLKEANLLPEHVLAAMKVMFVQTCDLTYDVLGEKAFWLYRARAGSPVWVERPAFIAYDPIMYAFSQLIASGEVLRRKAAEVRGALPSFYEENYAHFDGRKTNPSDIRSRDSVFLSFLTSFLP